LVKIADLKCEPCREGSQPLSGEQLKALLSQLPDWNTVTIDGVQQLQRQFIFKNYAEALAFTNALAKLAEAYDHHPAILLEWGKVTVNWWTHTVNGLHTNDFVLAVKTAGLA